jgi:molybdenum cofactor synthesis domain-containing protein
LRYLHERWQVYVSATFRATARHYNTPPMLNSDLKTAELFAIGNELLVGQVLDTNSHWLIRNITALGARVNRAAMIRDDYEHIGSELQDALRRGPRLIITTGGLGPTDDDMTLRAIARTLNLDMRAHPDALEMVRKRYEYIATIRENFSPDLNESRRKMAIFPEGGVPLFNPNGAAPGMALDVPSNHPDGTTTLVTLPGVPSEMKEIFASSMQVVLQRTIGAGGYVERTIVLDKGDESRIAELLKDVQSHHPSVYVKSRGQKLEDGLHLTVVLSLGGGDLAIIRQEVELTEGEAIAGLMMLGYAVKRVVES